jgi:hypothetical protein
MPRCEPWERDVIPCLCNLKDCQLDVSERTFHDASKILELQHAGSITAVQANEKIEECYAVAAEAYAACGDQHRRCQGLDPNDSAPKRFSERQRADFGRASNAAWRASAGLAFAAVVVTFGAPIIGAAIGVGALAGSSLAVGLAAGAAGCAFGATWFSDIATDPADRDFGTITQPEPPTPPAIKAVEELSKPIAMLLNALLTNQAESVGLGRAVVTALNKSQSAEAANDLDARDRQLTASRGFAAEWAGVLEKGASLRSDAAPEVAATAFGGIPVPTLEAIRLRSEIFASGWPAPIRGMFADYGISGQLQEDVFRQMRIRLIDLSALSATLADVIAARDLDKPEEEAVAALREFAAG